MQGFFTVYREVFAKLARAEAEAADRAAARGDKGAAAQLLPDFPVVQAPWADVSAFYQAWLHFVSDREFAWADAHNLASAPNRKVPCLQCTAEQADAACPKPSSCISPAAGGL